MPRVSDMVNIDVTKAKAILYETNITARDVSKEIAMDSDFLNQCFRVGKMRTKNIHLINKVCGIDLTPCIITEEKPEQIEMQMADTNSTDDLCNVIRESSNSQSKQSAVNTAGIVDAINELTNAVKELNNNLNANFDGQYKILDGMRMKMEKIKKY